MFYNEEYNEMGYDYFPGEYVYGDLYYIPEEYMEERWWPIPEAPSYMISDCGRVWSSISHKFLKPKPLDKHGHLGVCLSTGNGLVYRYIHRLMAEAFIPNRANYPIVRHLNDNPTCNYLDNFAWGTQKDNYEDARRNCHVHYVTPEEREIGLEKMRIPILAINLATGEEIHFRGQTEASKVLGIKQANIWKVLNGERRQAGGYSFKYIRGDAYV